MGPLLSTNLLCPGCGRRVAAGEGMTLGYHLVFIRQGTEAEQIAALFLVYLRTIGLKNAGSASGSSPTSVLPLARDLFCGHIGRDDPLLSGPLSTKVVPGTEVGNQGALGGYTPRRPELEVPDPFLMGPPRESWKTSLGWHPIVGETEG